MDRARAHQPRTLRRKNNILSKSPADNNPAPPLVLQPARSLSPAPVYHAAGSALDDSRQKESVKLDVANLTLDPPTSLGSKHTRSQPSAGQLSPSVHQSNTATLQRFPSPDTRDTPQLDRLQYPKLRRRPTPIGKIQCDSVPQLVSSERSDVSPVTGEPLPNHMRDTTMSSRAEAGLLSHSPALSSQPSMHPALRDSPRSDEFTQSGYYNRGACDTPSSRFTASPAFSSISYGSTAAPQSPIAVKQENESSLGSPLQLRSPDAAKAFGSQSHGASNHARHRVGTVPELAYLNGSPQNLRLRPQRPPRHVGDELLTTPIELKPSPRLQRDYPALFGASSHGPRDVIDEDRLGTPISPTTSAVKTMHGWDSRPNSSGDIRKRKDSAFSTLSPTTSRFVEPPSPSLTNVSSGTLPISPSLVSIASSHKGKGRIGRFFRKHSEPSAQDRQQPIRKGPVAGTGHEGYGKFGFRGRNFSLTNVASTARSSSRESTSSDRSSPPTSHTSSIATSQSDLANLQLSPFDAPEQALTSSRSLYDIKSQKQANRQNFFQRAFGRQKGKSKANEAMAATMFSPSSQSDQVGSPISASTDQQMSLDEVSDLVMKDLNLGNLYSPPRSRNGIYWHPENTQSASSLAQAREAGSPVARRPGTSFSRPLPPLQNQHTQAWASAQALPITPPAIRLDGSFVDRRVASPVRRSSEVSQNETVLANTTKEDNSHVGSSIDGEFLSLPLRKGSDFSDLTNTTALSSCSETSNEERRGNVGWLGDEDVWNEYNDLIDQVLSPADLTEPVEEFVEPPSAGSSLGAPFYGDETYTAQIGSGLLPRIHALIRDIEPTETESDATGYHAQDRLSQFLQPAATPNTPYSLSDIIAGYADRTESYASSKARQSTASGYSSIYSRKSVPPLPVSKVESGDTFSVAAEGTDAPSKRTSLVAPVSPSKRRTADADLRFGALMTSKWLSFGRVLFSPAHNEVKTGRDVRVLIVDGLGKDWSYYCALTYPNAIFYNLQIASSDQSNSKRGQDLSNYKNVRHTSIGAAFPFPKGFFNAAIFRFPIATIEGDYHACISECKRVLRPGGFLEVSVLDLDMMNTGSVTRKELRGLKMDINCQNVQVSLRNLGDLMVTSVGQRGFEDIQRCVVGIPVAGSIPRSEDTSSVGSQSSMRGSVDLQDRGQRVMTSDFASILHGQQRNSTRRGGDNDEDITQMVAKVGRWWYSTCYESVAGGDSGKMWEQPGLLQECERQGTAFRLLLCYAQKPTSSTRRTASV